MTRPKQWIPGDPLTADRLNVEQAESMRSRRDIALTNGSSLVNESLGNQSVNMRKSFMRLAVAIEDFAIPDEKTDLAEALDDVPSGLCQWFRLNRKSGNHVEDTLSTPFTVYDVLGGLNDQVQKVAGEFFYVVYNEDSKRWEILQSAGIKLKYGIVGECLGDGWYEVELSDWDEQPPIPGSESASASASTSVSASASDDPCDLCLLLDMTEAADCESVEAVEVSRTAGNGTGQIVYAHTAETIPLKGGSLVKMIKRAAADAASDSVSASLSSSLSASTSLSASDDPISNRLYDVVNSEKPLLSLPFPNYECCELPDGSKIFQQISCTRVIVEGVSCVGPDTPCPSSDSTSASESV
jgi:hypothetical protein